MTPGHAAGACATCSDTQRCLVPFCVEASDEVHGAAQVIERYELPVRITGNQNLILLDVEEAWKADIATTLGADKQRRMTLELLCTALSFQQSTCECMHSSHHCSCPGTLDAVEPRVLLGVALPIVR